MIRRCKSHDQFSVYNCFQLQFNLKKMWTPLGVKDYVLKKKKVDDGYDLYISDFIHIWSSLNKNETLLSIFKEMNPLIEAPDAKLIEKIVALFDEIKLTEKKLENNKSQLILHLSSDLSEIKFHFKLFFYKQDADLFFKEITMPLILLSARLQMRHNKLIEIICKKDAEINEYKKENFSIKRSHLITKSFDLDELKDEEQKNFCLSLEMINSNPSSILSVIDLDMFQAAEDVRMINKAKSEGELQKNMKCEQIDNKESNYIVNHNQQFKKNYMKCSKNKNKIEVQINSAVKRNHHMILKF